MRGGASKAMMTAEAAARKATDITAAVLMPPPPPKLKRELATGAAAGEAAAGEEGAATDVQAAGAHATELTGTVSYESPTVAAAKAVATANALLAQERHIEVAAALPAPEAVSLEASGAQAVEAGNAEEQERSVSVAEVPSEGEEHPATALQPPGNAPESDQQWTVIERTAS